MTNNPNTKHAGVERIPESLDALITAADGSLYDKAVESFPAQAERFKRAVRGELSEEECRTAWSDYSALALRTFTSGRLWTPEIVWILTPVLLTVCAEQDELERIKAAHDAMPEVDGDEAVAEQAQRVKSPFSGHPTLYTADALALGLECPREEIRVRAGYLTQEAQPSPLEPRGFGGEEGGAMKEREASDSVDT
jgi:hypothetical protein